MDKDRVKGKGQQAKGSAKETWGKATGKPETEASGKADKAKGKAQETWGKTKDEARAAKEEAEEKSRH